MKRRVAIAFLAAVLLLAGASVLVLRSAWAGQELCDVVSRKLRVALRQELHADACRVEPLRLAFEARGVRLGPAAAPLLAADAVRVRLAPIQALGGTLELAEVELDRPRLVATLPPPAPGAPAAPCPPEVLSRLRIRRVQVSGGSLDLGLPGGERLVAARVDVRAAPLTVARGLKAWATQARRTGLVVELAGGEARLPGRTVRIDSARADVDLAMDLAFVEVVEAFARGEGGRIELRGSVENLCRPALDLRVSAEAPLRSLLDAAGEPGIAAAGTAAADLRITGPAAAPAAEGELRLRGARLDQYTPGDVTARFRLAGTELAVPRLEVLGVGGNLVAQARLRLGKEIALEGEARLDGIELGDVLMRFGLPGAWVSMRVRGDVKAAGTVWPLLLHGAGSLELADFRVLDHAWDRPRPGERPIFAFPRGRVDTRATATPEGVRLADARIQVGAETLVTQADLFFDVDRGFAIEFAGGADLGELARVATVPFSGRAQLAGKLRAAPYGNPRVEATVRARELQLLQLDLGEVAGRVDYAGGDDFVLRATGLEGRRGETAYAGEVAVDLGGEDTPVEGRFEARGRLRDLFEGAMPWLPAARVPRDALDAPVEARARLAGPAAALGATFRARLDAGHFLGRPFDAGELEGRIEGGARAHVERAELRRAGGVLRAAGQVGLAAPFPWAFEGSGEGLPLEALGLPEGRWDGVLAGKADLGGSFEEPVLHFEASGAGIGARGVPVGDVQAAGALRGKDLQLTARTEGARLVAGIRTEEDWPYQARVELDVEDFTRFLPGGPPAGLRGRARGTATAEGEVAALGASRADVALEELQVGYADFRVQNRGPVRLAAAEGRVTVRALVLEGANTELSVSGAREADGRLSLGADGSVDLRLLGGLIPGVTRPRGQLLLEAHVAGTAGDPLLVGTGRLREAGFQLKELPITFTGLSGDLAFSQNRVVFDHLPALVNGGRAELDGEVELSRLVATRVRASARLEEVPTHVPASLQPVVSGQLAVAGTWDAMLLSGKLEVVRALYAERVDLEKRLLELRRRPAEARTFDRAGEWLRFDVGLSLSGDVRIDNDLVRGGLRGDLTLTGSLSSYGLVGSVAMTPGAVATFRGHDFQLTHAVAEFTERRRLRASLDAHGEAQVRDYQILMHAYGTLDEPQVQLQSVPSLTQEDIVTLLSVGITSRETAGAGGVTGAATAAAAQALFSAAGLDDQVKRFLPRDVPLKDFTVRITSGYSEGLSQVVPKAEVESRIGDRLRLRYQAPISGIAKGQKAQLEWRLAPRTSLQYQWDTDNPDVANGGDHGVDLRFRLEWSD